MKLRCSKWVSKIFVVACYKQQYNLSYKLFSFELTTIAINKVVCKFSVFGCFTNYKGNEVRNAQQPRLINKMNPVTTIHPARIYDKPSWLPTSSPACKPPKQRIFQQDELSLYKGSSTVKSFEEIGESLLQFLDSDYKCFLHDKHCLLQNSVRRTVNTTNYGVYWFWSSWQAVLLYLFQTGLQKLRNVNSKVKMLPNFPTYIQQESERWGNALDELHQFPCKKVLFLWQIWYALISFAFNVRDDDGKSLNCPRFICFKKYLHEILTLWNLQNSWEKMETIQNMLL